MADRPVAQASAIKRPAPPTRNAPGGPVQDFSHNGRTQTALAAWAAFANCRTAAHDSTRLARGWQVLPPVGLAQPG